MKVYKFIILLLFASVCFAPPVVSPYIPLDLNDLRYSNGLLQVVEANLSIGWGQLQNIPDLNNIDPCAVKYADANYVKDSDANHAKWNTAQPFDQDLNSIGELTGTSGFAKKTVANTWTLDTNTYFSLASQIDHNSLANYEPNRHIDWTSCSNSINTSSTGHFGGSLDTDGNLTVDGTIGIGVSPSSIAGINMSFSAAPSGTLSGMAGNAINTYVGTLPTITSISGLNFSAQYIPSVNLPGNKTLSTLQGSAINAIVTSYANEVKNITVTNTYGFKPAFTYTVGSGATGLLTATNVYNFIAAKPSLLNGATATNVFGLYVPDLTGTGITTAWGLAINNDSYINAKTSFGKATVPTQVLDVNGNGLISGTMTVSGGIDVNNIVDDTNDPCSQTVLVVPLLVTTGQGGVAVTKVLGDPNGWLEIKVNGVLKKIPYYNP